MKLCLTFTKSSSPIPTPIQLPLLLYFSVDSPHKLYILHRGLKTVLQCQGTAKGDAQL